MGREMPERKHSPSFVFTDQTQCHEIQAIVSNHHHMGARTLFSVTGQSYKVSKGLPPSKFSVLSEHSTGAVILCLDHTQQSQKKNRSKKFARKYEVSIL